MWAIAITEEHPEPSMKDHFFFEKRETRAQGKDFALRSLSIILTTLTAVASLGGDACGDMAAKILEDGDRLDGSDAGPWQGEASTCGEHNTQKRITYWLKEMTESEYEETLKLFRTAFPDGHMELDKPIPEPARESEKEPEKEPAAV